MLVKLYVKDYIIIDELDLDFNEGLNVLTGETGAGKSILLGALRLVSGERLSGNILRPGAKKALIQAVFSLNDDQKQALESWVMPEDDLLILSREVSDSGRSLIKVNDQLCTAQTARDISEVVLAIHGQFDHQKILDEDHQLSLLDAFLDDKAQAILSQVKTHAADISAINEAIGNLRDDPESITREIELTKYQMDDIDQANLNETDEDLDQRFDAMKHAEGLIHHLQVANDMLDSEDYEHQSLSRMFSDMVKVIQQISPYLPDYKAKAEWLIDMSYDLMQLKTDNDKAIQDMTFDGHALLTTEKRLDQVNHLKKKYGASLEKIADYRLQLDKDLQRLEEEQALKGKLEDQLKKKLALYHDLSDQLTRARSKVGAWFKTALMSQLALLNFSEAQVDIHLQDLGTVSSKGHNRCSFMISLNKGMPLEPLKKVASGGEISRVMLAIKSLLADHDHTGVLVFDEIDAGISGKTATVVARQLSKLSAYHQVICISHLAQVALFADAHYVIEKQSHDEATLSTIRALDFDGRTEEVSRIMGGLHVTDDIRANARTLLESTALEKRKTQSS